MLLSLFGPSGGAGVGITNAVLTIIDNDITGGYVEFNAPIYATNEDAVYATALVKRNGGSAGIGVPGYPPGGAGSGGNGGSGYGAIGHTT